MLKSKDSGLSSTWSVVKRHGACYTGGNIAIDPAGHVAACACSDRVALLDLVSGVVLRLIPDVVSEGPEITDGVTTFTFNPASGQLATVSSRSLQLRLWDVNAGTCSRSWRLPHRLPVGVVTYEPSGTVLATGAPDGAIILWDTDKGHITHSFRGGHTAVITALAFQPGGRSDHPPSVKGEGAAPIIGPVSRLASGSEDGRVVVWDLITQAAVAVMSEHFSAVTCLLFSPDPMGNILLTGSRDRVLNIWDTRDFVLPEVEAGKPGPKLKEHGPRAGGATPAAVPSVRATVPLGEALEAAVMLPSPPGSTDGSRSMSFVTAGDGGTLRRWHLTVTSKSSSSEAAERRYTVACDAQRTVTQLRSPSLGMDGQAAAKVAGQVALVSSDNALPVSQQFANLLLLPQRQVENTDTTLSTALALASKPAHSGQKRKRAGSSASDGLSSLTLDPFRGLELLAATRDQVITRVTAGSLLPTKTIVGYNDDIVDIKYIPGPGQLLAVATNSEALRLTELTSWSTRLCAGHTDVILAVSAAPDGELVATASKDKTARVWDVGTGACLAICEGHAEAVSCISWPAKAATFMHVVTVASADTSRNKDRASAPTVEKSAVVGTVSWLLTGSKDRTLKAWQLSPVLSQLPVPRPGFNSPGFASFSTLLKAPPMQPRTSATVTAHEKDVNTLAVAPNDRLAATGSADRTVRLWSLPGLTPVATLRGHKRGIWALAFSPSEQVLASCSGDKTVRLWSVNPATGFACLRYRLRFAPPERANVNVRCSSFEGHDASVLNVAYVSGGAQLVTTGADGLVKLWNTKDGECVNTFDAHTDKIWALAVRPRSSEPANGREKLNSTASIEPGELVTGGSDSVINVWRDVTQTRAFDEATAAEAALLRAQALTSAVMSRDFSKAIHLTLELDQPGRLGDILLELLEQGPRPPVPVGDQAAVDARYREAMLNELAALEAANEGVGLGTGDLDLEREREREVALGDPDPPASQPPAGVADNLMGLPPAVQRAYASSHSAAAAAGMAVLTTVLAKLPAASAGRLLRYIREWGTGSRHGILAHQVLQACLKTWTRSRILDALVAARERDAAEASTMLPGIGLAAAGAGPAPAVLGEGLTPIANPVVPAVDAEASGKPHTGAAAELRAFISAVTPYATRHAERIDRLLTASHALDFALSAMRVLRPRDDQVAIIRTQPVIDGALSRAAATSDSEDDDDDEEEPAEKPFSGGGINSSSGLKNQRSVSNALLSHSQAAAGSSKVPKGGGWLG